jgi:hypothetical protein
MKSSKLISTAVLGALAFSANAQAETNYKKAYQEPTRGFFLEHGKVNNSGKASLELHSGAATIDNGGGIRLGLPGAELILNSGLTNSGSTIAASSANDATIKFSLPPLGNDDGENSNFDWAILTGISSLKSDAPIANNSDQLHFKVGIAATLQADAATITIAPSIRYVSNDASKLTPATNTNGTFFELGLGGYLGLIDTEAGLFSAGLELNITTQDNVDNQLTLGARWAYNENINIDIIPVVLNNNNIRTPTSNSDDTVGLPGLVRLNVAF